MRASSCASARSSTSSATSCWGSSIAASRPGRSRERRVGAAVAGAGNVVHYDRDGLVAEARRAGCTLELVPMMGDFVTRGAPLVRVQGDGARLDRKRVRQLIALDDERDHNDDPAYGFRKLADVAQRALGTSSNDATTAVQVVNRLHDC